MDGWMDGRTDRQIRRERCAPMLTDQMQVQWTIAKNTSVERSPKILYKRLFPWQQINLNNKLGTHHGNNPQKKPSNFCPQHVSGSPYTTRRFLIIPRLVAKKELFLEKRLSFEAWFLQKLGRILALHWLPWTGKRALTCGQCR